MIQPITPQEAFETAKTPDYIIEVINGLIKEKFSSHGITHVYLDDINKEARKHKDYVDSIGLTKIDWNSVADLFREVGWTVSCSIQTRDPHISFFTQEETE